jgi:hypothetical protein
MSGEVAGEVAAEVKVPVVPTLEDRVAVLEANIESLENKVDILLKAEVGMEFSKEDRAAIIDAMKGVHGALGTAFGVLAGKDIGYKSVFDSKHGVLSVQLFKIG